MKHKMMFFFTVMTAMMLVFSTAQALLFDDVTVLVVSGEDQGAVIRIGGGDVHRVSVGSSIETHSGAVGIVSEISEDRLVIDLPDQDGSDRYIIRLKGERQVVQRVMKPTLVREDRRMPMDVGGPAE